MYKSFEEMPVWQKAMDLAVQIFRMTENLPRNEDYGLTSQIRRSALSVSANIAEAFGREHTLDKLNFYYHSRGSLSETKSHLLYGKKVGYFEEDVCDRIVDVIDQVWRDLNRIISSMRPLHIEPKPKP